MFINFQCTLYFIYLLFILMNSFNQFLRLLIIVNTFTIKYIKLNVLI